MSNKLKLPNGIIVTNVKFDRVFNYDGGQIEGSGKINSEDVVIYANYINPCVWGGSYNFKQEEILIKCVYSISYWGDESQIYYVNKNLK